MIFKISFFCIAIFVSTLGCSGNHEHDTSNAKKEASQQEQGIVESNVIKVYVEKDGEITADGNKISLNDLDASFSKLKANNGTVYYSRASIEGDPPKESMKVMELIVKYSLPVKLFTDKTFSVIVTQN